MISITNGIISVVIKMILSCSSLLVQSLLILFVRLQSSDQEIAGSEAELWYSFTGTDRLH